MVSQAIKNMGLIVLAILVGLSFNLKAKAEEPQNLPDATFKSRCQDIPACYPECADSPSECASDPVSGNTPFNCLFLQEPIGGKPGYDLYRVTCMTPAQKDPCNANKKQICIYTPWFGEAIVGKDEGPFQAVLAYEKGKELQGSFGLLYNYLGLIYNFLSGIIVGMVILIIIIGGIRISTAGANADGAKSGKDMIIKALVGMVLWFTASVILYTINPTFFAF